MGDRRLTGFERFVEKAKEDPLVPIGALATVGCLAVGLHAFYIGNSIRSQNMMRGRILAQTATIVAMYTGVTFSKSRPDDLPKTYLDKFNELRAQPNIYAKPEEETSGEGEGTDS